MELSEILDTLSGSNEQVKTASENHSSRGSLSAAIDRALSVDSLEKTAGYSDSPGHDLIKIAQDISNAEQDALIKEAHIYGRAVADGFAARMSQYQGSGYQGAGSSADTVKEAMELGYIHASNAISKSTQGFSKTASDAEFAKVSAYQEGQQDAVKVASFIQGQQDAAEVVTGLTKIASQYEDFGFKVGNSILKRL